MASGEPFDPYDFPLAARRIGPLLGRRAASEGDRPYLTVGGRTFGFADTDREVRALARGLAARGLEPNEFLAVVLPNCAETIFAWYACALVGAANVPINVALRGPMLETPLSDSRARGCIIHRDYVGSLATIDPALAAQLDWVAVVGGLDGLALPAGPREYLDYAALPIADGPDPERETDYRQVQTVFYTSGTTGPAKGVQTLNAHQFSASCGFLRAVGLTRDDVLYTPYPLFHGLAARLGVLPALIVGAHVVVGERFSVSRFWEDATRANATVAHIMPATARMLAEQPPGPFDRAHRIRAMFNTRVDPAFEERFGVKLVEAFSMTETGFVLYTRWPERRPGAVGRVHEDWEVRLVDERDRPVPRGEPGLMVVRPKLPYIMMQGYLNRPAETVEALRNLWFHTGDILREDADGYFYYIDRAKERIRRRGENISSYDIETVAGRHPAIAECAALPHPASAGEDDIRLLATLEPGATLAAADLDRWLAERLPQAMRPRYIEIVARLPRTPTNKVEKSRFIADGLGAGAWDRTIGGSS